MRILARDVERMLKPYLRRAEEYYLPISQPILRSLFFAFLTLIGRYARKECQAEN